MRRSSAHAGVALDHGVLHFDRATHGVDDAAELDERAVAGALDDAPVMRGDGRDRSGRCAAPAAAPACDPRPRPASRLIADHVGDQDRRDFPGLGHSSGSPALRRPSNDGSRFGAMRGHQTFHACSLGLSRRASARAVFASSILPFERVARPPGSSVRINQLRYTGVDGLAAFVDRGVAVPEASSASAMIICQLRDSRIARTQPHGLLDIGLALVRIGRGKFRLGRASPRARRNSDSTREPRVGCAGAPRGSLRHAEIDALGDSRP